MSTREARAAVHEIAIPSGLLDLPGTLTIPESSAGVVLFAHGSGSSRHSPRNRYVAQVLHRAGIGTLLFDLLSPDEDAVYQTRFDIGLLAERLLLATEWLERATGTTAPPFGYFGASTGAAAALAAAAKLDGAIAAVVSRGGRPDLAGVEALARVTSPTLLIVGGEDTAVIELNRDAHRHLRCERSLVIVPSATHLFEEPGTLEEAARLAAAWFKRWFPALP